MTFSAKLRLVFLLLLTAVLLAGCGGEPTAPTESTAATAGSETGATEPGTLPPPELTYEETTCDFSERYGDSYGSERAWKTVYNGVTYLFTAQIPEEDRLTYVLESDGLIRILLENHPDHREALTVVFRHDGYPARVLDHTLYIGIEHFKTQAYAVGMAVMTFGHDVNYGILYAHGTRAAQQMGYAVEENPLALTDALTLRDTQPVYLDLSYPCFLEEYAEAATLPKVQALALYYYDYLTENGKLDLLSDYSDSKYCHYLSAFLAENGRDGYDNSDLGGTVFYNGGPKLRLVWENADAVFYLEDDYQAQYRESHFESDMLNSSYAELRQLVVDYQAQADYMEALLGHWEPEDGRVDVLFTEPTASEEDVAAQYHYDTNLIEMFAAGPYLHEYTHYLLRETGIDPWMNELLCYYYGYTPVDEQITYQWADEATRIEALNPKDPADKNEYSFISILKQHLDRELDWRDPADFAYIFSAYAVVTRDYDNLTNPRGGAQCKLSFLTYLIGLVGEDAALNAIVTDTPEAVFGSTWDTLIADWEAALRAEYAWLSKYYVI